MQPLLVPLFLGVLLNLHTSVTGLCALENGTTARCHELGDVKYIETYDLNTLKTSVSESILRPGYFENLTTLRHLYLPNGLIKLIEPGSFRKLSDLRTLDLSNNLIGHLELDAFIGLKNLHHLNLRRNALKQLPAALGRLKNLRSLEISGNPFLCNCATLRVRDFLRKRSVKVSKKVVCAGPGTLKGTSLAKPDAKMICTLEEQDREMQMDQPMIEGSGTEDTEELDKILDEYDSDDDDKGVTREDALIVTDEFETPVPNLAGEETVTISENATTQRPELSIPATEAPETTTKASEDDGLFFDSTEDDRRKESSWAPTTAATTSTTKDDRLIIPVEGSGDEGEEGENDPGLLEGSGVSVPEIDWGHVDVESSSETTPATQESTSNTNESFFDMVFGVFYGTTAAPEIHEKESTLEEEHFIDASNKTPDTIDEDVEKVTVPTVDKEISPVENEIVKVKMGDDESKPSKIKDQEAAEGDEVADASAAKQSKKSMGSYVVLAALLAILIGLIAFAAYKGDFCKKKRKRNDEERGTEMKDMQKSLLESSNTAQPKIASNGNMENVPLVHNNARDDGKDEKLEDNNGVVEPVKPPRKNFIQDESSKANGQPQESNSSVGESKDSVLSRDSPDMTLDSNSTCPPRNSDVQSPPLSPDAQRVKITLQENPDSVPKTPILITRTMAGENLVKTP